MVQRSSANILVLQETKLLEGQKLAAAADAARAHGWNPTLTHAHQTAAGKASGGSGVLVRKGMGAQGNTDKLVRDGMRHRISFTWVDGILRGGLHCGSIWLYDSQGLSEANMTLLEEAAVALNSCTGGWVCGGTIYR